VLTLLRITLCSTEWTHWRFVGFTARFRSKTFHYCKLSGQKLLPKIMINWKPEGRGKNEVVPKNLERWDMYSLEWKRSQNGGMEQWKAMEYGSRKASPDVSKPRNIYSFNTALYQYVLVTYWHFTACMWQSCTTTLYTSLNIYNPWIWLKTLPETCRIVFCSLTYAVCWLYSCHKPKHVAVECNNTFIVYVVGEKEYFGVNIRETGTANELGSSSQRPLG
jgi:hypothetical protein